MSLSMSTSAHGTASVLAVGGAIDTRTAGELRDALAGLIADGATRIVVDLEGVDFLDSSALGALVGAHKDLAAINGSLTIVCTRVRLLKVFGITRLNEVIPIVDSVAAAAG